MAELTVSQIIKLVIGALVIVAVAVGIYFVFGKNIFGFFGNIPGKNISGFWEVFL